MTGAVRNLLAANAVIKESCTLMCRDFSGLGVMCIADV